MCAILAVDAAVMIAVTSWGWALIFLALIVPALIGGGRMKRRRATVRRRPPCATVPRWPGWGGLALILLYTVGSIGLLFFPFLLSMWSVQVEERAAAASYRADRLSSVLYGLACAPAGAFLGILAFSPAYGSPGWLAGTLLSALTVSAAVWIAGGSSYSLLKLTELGLAVKWRERVDFLHVLDEAEHNGVLLCTRAGYAFRDSALQGYLIATGEAASPDRERGRASWFTRFKAAKRSWAARLLRWALTQREPEKTPQNRTLSAASRWLSKPRIDRITFDFSVGTAIAVLAGYLLSAIPAGTRVGTVIVCALFFPLLGFAVAAVAGRGLLRVAADAARTGAVYVPLVSRKVRVGAAALVVAAGAVLVAEAGTFLANSLAFLLPPAFVTACGLWLCVLAFRKRHTSPRGWPKRVPDQVAVATSAAALLVAADRQLLTTQWATVLLFPVAVAGSLRLWTVMGKAKRLIIRAGADIALSLLLGGELVLFLVWLANVLGMPRAEVSLIRTGLGSAGSYAGVYDGGRMWAGIYATLAMASLILALYPDRLKRLTKWFDPDRPNPAKLAVAAQRAVTGLYIGVLTIVFVGAAGPSALTPTLHRQLKATYVVALQRQLETEAEASAYDEIRAEINALTLPGPASILVYLVQEIHHDAHQSADAPGATKAEAALAHRLGEDQAAALDLPGPASPGPAVAAAADSAELDQPVHDAQQISNLATETTAEENASDQASRNRKAAFELMVTALANAIPIPSISKNEVAQILTQYVSGLVNDSKVTEAFETWLVQHRKKPASAEELIVPAPDNLDNATQNDLSHEANVQGVTVIPPDVNGVVPNPSSSAAELDQAMINDAVNSANQAQEIQQTGSCPGCLDLGNNGSSNDDHNDDQQPDTHVGDQ